jgi:hypothetical protein
MIMLTLANEVVAAAPIDNPGDININNAKATLTGILLVGISLVLGWLTLKSLLGDAKHGNYSGVAKVGLASVLAMIPLALGAGIATAMGYGASIVNFVGQIIT